MVRVIFENPDVIALMKPAGVLVHGVPVSAARKRDKAEETVVDWLLARYPGMRGVGDDPARPGIVHRLDRDTSGVLLVAKNQRAFEYLKGLFQGHKIQKTYLALVCGRVPKRGVVNVPLGLRAGTTKRSPVPKQSFGTGRSTRAGKMKMVKEAVTEYVPLEAFTRRGERGEVERYTLLRLTPKTGRTHQLRVHMAALGHPVVGDALYGPKRNPLGLARQFLHAESLEFTAPDWEPSSAGLRTGKRLRLEAELPVDLARVLDALRRGTVA